MTQSHNKGNRRRKTAYMGLFLALALICSYVEALIPFHFGIPGVKLGLTNIVVIFVLYCIGPWEALGISVFRIVISGFLFGNVFSILYSLAGGLFSYVVMLALKKWGKINCFCVSIAGGLAHNIGQLFMAAFLVSNLSVFYYAPVLLLSGAVMGLLIGIIAQEIVLRVGDRIGL